MYELLYAEINIVCILILIYILYRNHRSGDQRMKNVAFNRVVIITLVILTLDACWVLIEHLQGPAFHTLNEIVNAVYLFVAGLVGYSWLIFTEYWLKRDLSRRKKTLLTLPLLALAVLCALSPWTGWLFFIDEHNIYHRGPLIMLQYLVAYGYLLGAAVRMLLCMLRERCRVQRGSLWALASFFALPLAAGVISAFFYGMPVVWPATTLSLLKAFLSLQNDQISTDSLTRLNNRRQFDQYMSAVTAETHHAQRLFLILMDIDLFKRINDTYGHVEGDNALIAAASLLKKACSARDAFLARYGGDEFAIVYLCSEASDA